MKLVSRDDLVVVRYLGSRKQVHVPQDVPSAEAAFYEPNLRVLDPKYENDSPDGPGYETSVFVYNSEDEINWPDGVRLFQKMNNPDVPAMCVTASVKDVKEVGLIIASQPYDDGTPHASIRGWSDDDKKREEQSDQLTVKSHCVLRPSQKSDLEERAREIWRSQHPVKKKGMKKHGA